ncbi:MAG: response regulator [Aureispira sp.]|nr:response regulator [Aureispira sp.]
MRKYVPISFVFFILLLPFWSEGQSYLIKTQHLSIEDGLSNRFVRAIHQDSRGFIWIATNYGLNRFDGYEFTLFTKEQQELSNNAIYSIYEDADSCLWIDYFDKNNSITKGQSIDIIIPKTQKAVPLEQRIQLPFPKENLARIHQANNNQIFVVSKEKELYEYKGKGQFENWGTLPCNSSNAYLQSIKATKSTLWIVCNNILYEIDSSKTLVSTDSLPNHSNLDHVTPNGELQGYTNFEQNKSVQLFQKNSGTPIQYHQFPLLNLPKQSVRGKLRKINEQLYWYNTDNTVWIFNNQGKLLYDFSGLILEDEFYEAYFDRQQNIWVATTNGIYLLNITPNKFTTYLNKDIYIPNSILHSTRGIVKTDSNELFVNTYNGRRKIDLATGEVSPIASKLKTVGLAAIKDHKGNLWFSAENGLVERYNPINSQSTYYQFNKRGLAYLDSLVSPMLLALHEDKNHRIWVGSSDGLYYISPKESTPSKYTIYHSFTQLNTSSINSFCETNDHIWLGTNNGIYLFSFKLGIKKHYSPQNPDAYIPHEDILYIHSDKDSSLWLGTKGGGLIHWYPETGDYQQYTIGNGLSDNVIYAILEDDDGYLWLSSNYGLMRFDKASGWVNTYLPRDGITHEEFNNKSYYKDENGTLYFGGLNGINVFSPKDIQKNTSLHAPLRVLECQKWNGQEGALQNITQEVYNNNTFTLHPKDNFFTIKLALLNFKDAKKNKYAYKIIGLDQNWNYSQERLLRISRLPYGKYKLHIKAQGENGHWSAQELLFNIDVVRPFYKTLWFDLLIIVLALLLILAYFYRLRRANDHLENEVNRRTLDLQQREQELLQAKNIAETSSKAKAEFLSVMSHEMRTPMNAVINLANLLTQDNANAEQVENLDMLQFSAKNLLAIINDVLDFNKIESGMIKFEKIPFNLNTLINSIRYTMDTLVATKKNPIEFKILKCPDIPPYLTGDPTRLTQILNNLISNAIKFTDTGNVELKIECIENLDTKTILLFTIKDTGIGISKDKLEHIFQMFTQASTDTTRKYGGTGLGLAITKRLLELQNSEIQVQSELNKGSIFSFQLEFDKTQKPKEIEVKPTITTAKPKVQTGKILVVEDNKMNVLVIKKFLTKWGFEFEHAADGQIAVNKIQQTDYDLILMDIHMPNMDGYEATQFIRNLSDEKYKTLPIIALTASAMLDKNDKFTQVGMNDVVTKPFNPEGLHATILKHLKTK